MKPKKCIICHKPFIEAPPEHVIPKSIGGQYTVHNVCKECNSDLNKSIDEPFKEHKLIGIYRFLFEIKGRGKKVIDPMSKETINIDGIDYRLKLMDDLKIDARQKPDFPKIANLKIDETFQVTLDGRDMNLLDNFISKLSKEKGIPKEHIRILSKTETFRPEKNALISFDNNTVLMEFSKILHEAACDLIGKKYMTDKTGKRYAAMLKSGIIDHSMKSELNPDNFIINEVFLQLIPNFVNMKDSHAIIISGYVGLGLVGFVKIFDAYHVQILSWNKAFCSVGMKIVLNNFENKELGIYEPRGVPNSKININPKHIIEEYRLAAEFKKNPPNKKYPVYNSAGRRISNTIFDLLDNYNVRREISTDFKSKMTVTMHFFDAINIKPKSLTKPLPIESIIFNFNIRTLKRRGNENSK
ncbi:MAG: HNH endonuclease [Bacteroidetes bacterium]|nr:HNH endonuclease [Bacteroidota bacterium]